ncbi:cytochrome C [Desulfovibrio aerotolerans]|uniref:Cytochrome C n=1 Tax=Solidesulfovibrio aerotolerans TaxID=295255 RepID=A0A7C9IMQ8_9BACT|nr:cytochrome c3 family protein [Solidesulfovibrio aerotolerans]MYL82619.1 cytochrome C [Solidesulfovibrio aerotolerans]
MRSKVMLSGLIVMVCSLAMATAAFCEGGKFSGIVDAKSTLCYPLELTFKRPSGVLKTSFAPVKFSHGQHASVACVTCHHMWDGKSEVQGCAEAGCHDNLKERQEATSYFRAFHDKNAENSCLGCHLKANVARKDKGQKPLSVAPCSNNGCHVAAK